MESYKNYFDTAISVISEKISRNLKLLPKNIKEQIQEIRLRIEQPVSVCCAKGIYFIHKDGGICCFTDRETITVSREDMEETFRKICSYAVYSHQNEIKNGYITIRGGHRVGICGSAVRANGNITGIRDISSFNIRIAREVKGAANEIFKRLDNNLSGGLLLAGPPSSGKTTVLRDIARQLSCGATGQMRKVAIVDERGELAASCFGTAQNDLGPCCDVLDAYPKGEGILQAVRSLSPEYIICDELGSNEETLSVEEGLNAGVTMIASIHANSQKTLLKRKQAVILLATGAFENVILLGGNYAPGKIQGIYKAGDLLAEMDRNSIDFDSLHTVRLCGIA